MLKNVKNVLVVTALAVSVLVSTSCEKEEDLSGQCGYVLDYWLDLDQHSGRTLYYFQMDFNNKVKVDGKTWMDFSIGDYICLQ